MSCHFEKGFHKRTIPYNQLNHKDLLGRKLFILLLLTIIPLLCLVLGNKSITFAIKIGLLITFSLYLYITYSYYSQDPIRLLYMGGYWIHLSEYSSPFPDIHYHFPNHTLFENPNHFNNIKNEVLGVLQDNASLPLTKNTFNKSNKEIGSGIDGEQKDNENGWKILMISTGSTFTPKGLQKCPYLCKLVKSCPEILSCVISILPPHKGIPIHVGYYKGILRYQLGVIIPKDRKNVFLCVNGQRYHWREGRGVLFDDTFAHKVYNNSNDYRVVIYMDIKRQHLPFPINKLNDIFIKALLNSKEVKDEISRTEYQVTVEGFLPGINHHV